MAARMPRVVMLAVAMLLAAGAAASAQTPPIDIGTSADVPTPPGGGTTLSQEGTDGTPDSEGGSGNGSGGGSSGPPVSPDAVEKEVAVPPVIHCVWITADMNPDSPGVQRIVDGASDDLPDVPTPTPCGSDPASGAPVSVPVTQPVAQVRPWSADSPSTRTLEVWMVTSHAAGPTAIDATSIALASENVTLESGDLIELAGIDEPLDAGVVSGQIGSVPGGDLGAMITDGWAVAATAASDLSYLDGCGVVEVTATATANGESTQVTVPFEVPCYHHLLADFDSIEWGGLVRGAETLVEGDLDSTTSSRPTLTNAGNTPIVLATTFDPLCRVDAASDCFGEFGVELSGASSGVHRIEPTPPGTEMVADAPVVCPGSLVKFDVLVRTPDAVTEGDYRGSMDVVGQRVEAVCEPPDVAPTIATVPTTSPSSTSPSSTSPSSTTTVPDVADG